MAPSTKHDEARRLLHGGRAREAFAAADALLRENPEDAQAWAFVAGALAALGETEMAERACARAAELAPYAADLRVELGRLREALGRPGEAVAAYEAALGQSPSPLARLAALVALSGVYGRAGRYTRARAHAEAALALEGAHQGALQNLAAIADHQGRVGEANALRERAYRGRPLIVERALRPLRRVLTLASAARANSPDRQLIPASRYDRLTFFPAYADGPPRETYDVVFNAVADADAASAMAGALSGFLARNRAPMLNPPERIARTARALAPALFAGAPGLVVPDVWRIETVRDFDGLAVGPWVMRPAGAHGGEGVALRTGAQARAAFDGRPHYLTAFSDYRSPDGLYRKYRVFFVGQAAFPYHLAIHDDWLVHYQTSLTAGRADLRAEERRFLDDPRAALGEVAFAAIAEVGRRLRLDFAGVDFSVLPDGRALLFEANATMCAHDEPADSPLAYKNLHVARIFAAFQARLEAAGSAMEEGEFDFIAGLEPDSGRLAAVEFEHAGDRAA